MTDRMLFEAELVPYRSLSARGLAWLLGSLGVASLAVTTLFWCLGAWPIAGFNGGEMLLAALLLRSHMRGSRVRELLQLTESRMRILRFDEAGGHTQRSLPAAWLTVRLEEKPGRVPGLFLTAHGCSEEVARVLGEPQKRDLAEALRTALYQLRHPIFENPQLARKSD